MQYAQIAISEEHEPRCLIQQGHCNKTNSVASSLIKSKIAYALFITNLALENRFTGPTYKPTSICLFLFLRMLKQPTPMRCYLNAHINRPQGSPIDMHSHLPGPVSQRGYRN